VINGLHQEVCKPRGPIVEPGTVRHFSSWGRAMERLCTAAPAIDQSHRLQQRLAQNLPVAFFPGDSLALELELFVLHAVRARLGLKDHDPLTRETLKNANLAPIYVIARESPCAGQPTVATVRRFLDETPNQELRLIFRQKTCRVVAGRHLSPGIDVRELGSRATTVLRDVENSGGFLVACAEHAAATLDILDIERFVVGRAEDPFAAGLLGVAEGEGFVQWLPAGLRFTLAYPTPVQTGKSLAQTLESKRFARLCSELGEGAVLSAIHADAAERGSPVERVLDALESGASDALPPVEQRAVGGVYDDGHPWSGNVARLRSGVDPLRYRITSSDAGPITVSEFVRRFEADSKQSARIAWNGGYILNAELVGKLGLSESYIGSPLGLIISDGRVLCPPLYGKPAFVVSADGRLSIRRVSAAGGLRVRCGGDSIEFGADAYDPETAPDGACYYDLLFSDDSFPGQGRTLVRLAGTRIMEIVHTKPGEDVTVFPVGLTLSFPPGTLPDSFEVGGELEIELPALDEIAQAVEAGPLLVEDGDVRIDMEGEGRKTENSIRTQAARLDYLDMRGPKIAVGLDKKGALIVLTVNGRIRESVGATHSDMAEIMRSLGAVSAMGFDPGGSSTLVVGHEAINISPYNPDYERNVWSMRPQPRGVSNVVIGH
jgi:exopolysaccharide biosynthesis protein